ncbi:MAG: hypothetical protein ACOX04_07175 [Candidatus Scatomorpha sp.]
MIKWEFLEGGAVSDPNSKYRSWYNFIEYPSKYHSWWGIDTLPCVNELDEGFLDYIIFDDDSVVSKYLNLGADGIRLDVADELPDEFLSLLKKRVKEIKSDALVIGEVWEDASNKESYGIRRRYFVDSTLDSVMNYPYQNAIIGFVNETLRGYDFAKRYNDNCRKLSKTCFRLCYDESFHTRYAENTDGYVKSAP